MTTNKGLTVVYKRLIALSYLEAVAYLMIMLVLFNFQTQDITADGEVAFVLKNRIKGDLVQVDLYERESGTIKLSNFLIDGCYKLEGNHKVTFSSIVGQKPV